MSKFIKISAPQPEDADAILELVMEINRLHDDPLDKFTAETVQRDVYGADSPISVRVAKIDDQVAGFVFYHPSYDSGYGERGLFITDILVSEAFRRRGVARALIKDVAEEADKMGYTYLWWASQPWNKAAQAFYSELGALEEPVVAHALVSDKFRKLLEE